MNKYIVLTHQSFPFYDKLKQFPECFKLLDIDQSNSFFQDIKKMVEDSGFETQILDLTILATDTKRQIYHFLTGLYQTNDKDVPRLFADLTFCWGELLFEEFSNLDAAMALSFHSPTQTYEVAVKNHANTDYIETLFENLEVKSSYVKSPGIGFSLPRVCSQIINEAFFSKQDHLASKDDIDTAMKFGVNYPLGPFEWSKKSSLKGICLLLDELTQVTGDPRYRASKLLRKEALLQN